MKLRYNFGTRFLAMLLTLAMVFSYLPAVALTASAATADRTVVDPHTLDQWMNYFGVLADNPNNVRLTTEYAGGVWTDKSVFDPDSLPAQLTGATYNGNGFPVTDKGDNFIVSLSAIASNKQIKGYSTVPTDTVLVLDLSSSMRYTDDAGTSAVDELVEATNKAMTQLLALNKNNRIAVVVYAGNVNKSFSNAAGNVSVVLPLDAYTTDRAGVFLQTDPVNSNNPYALAVYDGVSSATGNANTFRTNGFEVATGTFMQGGIYEAMKILLNTDPIVQEGVQKGTARMPIMVWMTDGESTMANPDYNGNDERTSIGTTTMHDYNGSTGTYGHRDTISFVTSLTAAFANKTVAEHYGQDPLIYTLPYGDAVLNRAEALSVLNPAQASTTQNNLWNAFLNGQDVQVYRYRQNNRYQYYTVRNSNATAERLEAADRLYVDKYFPASNDDQMLQAFQDIVDEIILQSKYYPTYVQKDVDHDGYLTFVDKIGEYMEVSDVKGIIIGDRLFSGAALAGMLNQGNLGTTENPSALGNAVVNSVKERLGITNTATAQALLNSAFAHGQLAYNSDTDFSHYIGWYSDSQGNYLDFWHQGMTADQTPANATHIIRSYAFLGDTRVIPGVANTDMMYMSVRVAREIATNETIVTWQIPASLIPTLTYDVEVEVDSDGNITDVIGLSLESNTAQSPIRLIYEVELQGHIQDWNMADIVDPNYTTNKDPGYVFYSNKWTSNADDTERNTYSHFEPSAENERYYFTHDTEVLVQSGGSYVPYTGSARPSGSGYYYAYQCFELLNDGTLRSHIHYEPITDAVLHEDSVVQEDGQWIVKKGTVHRYYDYEISPKEFGAGDENTNTMGYSDHPFMFKQGDHYYTYSTQGNNGKLVMTPATGLKLTKSLEEGFTTDSVFTFQISGDIANAQVVRLNAQGSEASRTALPANGQVTLQAGETVYIVGLTASAYTVSEVIPAGADYRVSTVKVDNAAITGTQAQVTLSAQDITDVEFVNGFKGYGSLIVGKDVVHPFNTVPDAITNKVFHIQVQLSGADVANASFPVVGIAGTTQITTDANGSFTLELHDNESVTIENLPDGVTYTVTEVLTAADAGYRLDTANSTLEGTIYTDQTAMAQVVNVYEPAAADTTLTITGTKTVTSQSVPYDWTGKSFQFLLESYDPETQTYTVVEQATATENGGRYTFDSLVFDTLGTYYYKISEVIPEENQRETHMSYDSTVGRIVVHVTDNDLDGKLEIDVQDYVTGASLPITGNVITFTKDFVNTYTEDYDPTAVEFTVDKEIVDPHNTGVTAAGFLFGLFKPGETQPSYTMRTTGEDGKATFHIPITEPIAGDTYILREIIPADADKIPGMTYSTTEYTVVISATAEGSVLTGTVTIDGAEGVEPVFTNTISLNTASAQFGVEKIMAGVPTAANDFTFTLTETDGSFVTAKPNGVSQTITISGAGEQLFDAIAYTAVGTHYYVVTENVGTNSGMTYDGAVYHIIVTVTANGADLTAQTSINKLGVGAVSEITFTNTYALSGETTATIQANKVLTGRSLLNGEFSFQLVEANADGTPKAGGVTLTAENGPADGNNQASVVFAPITYTETGTYYYKITEIPGANNIGLTYDGTYGIVAVYVTDNGNGGLTASWSVIEGDVDFTNSYKPTGTSTQIFSSKDLTGRVLKDGEFFFELYETDADFSIDGRTPKQTVSNNIHGLISFDTLYFSDECVKYYVIKEQPGTVGGVTYDETVYHVTIRVVDNHKGQLETFTSIDMVDAEGNVIPVSSIVFYNEYAPVDTEVVFTVEKTVTGLTDRSGYQFGLYTDPNGAPVEVVTSDADGVVSFTAIPYSFLDLEQGTFTYYIAEIAPAGAVNGVLNGITYDSKVYEVVVTLTDDMEGNLVATYTVDGADVDENTYRFAFTNTYQVSSVEYILRATKIYEREDGEPMEHFDFVLEGEGFPTQTQQNNDEGHITFDPLVFTEAGEYTFTIREQHNILWGFIKWDENVYTVTITVEEDTSLGILYIDGVVITSLTGEDDLVFRNIHEDMITQKDVFLASDPQISIDGNKVRIGDVLNYTISYTNYGVQPKHVTITDRIPQHTIFDGVATAPYELRENGTVLFWDLGMVQPDTTVTVEFEVRVAEVGTIENQAVVMEGDNEYQTNSVTNTVDDAETELALSGEKVLHNMNIRFGQFTFALYDSEGNELETVKNVAGGQFTFSPIRYTVEDVGKTFTYTIREIEPDDAENHVLDGITYDQTVYTVTVQPVYNAQGELDTVVTVVGSADNKVVFNNYYDVSGNAQVELLGIKRYVDAQGKPLAQIPAGAFYFRITGPDGYTELVSNVTGGNFDFSPLNFDADDIGKSFTYTIEEVAGDQNYITYDTTVHTLVITVSDDGRGGLKVTKFLNGQEVAYVVVSFVNTYHVVDGGSIEIVGNKTYTDSNTGEAKAVEAGQFTFRLTGHGLDLTTTNDENGNFKFDLVYTAEDVGKEFIYTVSEVPGDKAYISYDGALFRVKVTVEDNGEGGLKITKTLLDGDITFENIYNTIGSGSVEVDGVKAYTDARTGEAKPITAGQFAFRLSGNGVDETVYCDENGNFSFSTLYYGAQDVGKTYLYTIEEIAGDKAYITYDTAKYTLKVTVEDNGEGGLTISKALLNAEGEQIESIAFHNVYNVISGGQTELSGTKAYTDARTGEAKPIAAGQFGFRISGNGVDETVYCDENGNFHFAPLTYTAADIGKIFTYTVEEIAGDVAYITYDAAKYTLEVTVEDNGEGGLKITQKLLGSDGKQVESLAFHNAYNVIGEGQVDIAGIKRYEGRDLVGNDFSFTLSQDGNVLQTVQNAADGSFVFEALRYTAADIGKTYTYIVQELRPEGAALNADGVYELDGVVYDSNIYTVQVTVEDDGQGGLKITKTVNGEETEQIQVVFDNKYQISGTAVLEIPGTKTLTGRDMKDGEFTFGLYLNGKLVSSATNVNGAFVLSAVYGAEDLGDYLYTVAEIKGTDGDITYDDTVYQVKVRVYDDGKGGVAVAYKIVDAAQILFENVYTPPVTPETGDNFPVTLFISLMILSTFGIAAVVVCKKHEKKEEIAE